MVLTHTTSPAVTIALALAAGMVAQVVARHLRIPGIVVLLATGLLLGPDGAGVVRPESLGAALHLLVGFAVAVILFQGGMNLDLKRMRREAAVIRRLITVGALVTGAGAALAAGLLMGWDLKRALSLGALVMVTGPTVVTPLLNRIRIKADLETILEAEAVLIDPLGAIVALVLLEVLYGPPGMDLASGPLTIVLRLGAGAAAGLISGGVLAYLLRVEPLVPEGLDNAFTLSMVLALYQVSNALLPESGTMAVTVAGIVVGNSRSRDTQQLLEFKEQLTALFIGLLFILLSAGIRLTSLQTLGRPALLMVGALMFIIRPVSVFLCTWRSRLSFREKLFLSWLAPRGVVAAALASLFAQRLEGQGGEQLQALVFAVIAATVVVQGLTGGPLAWVLGLQRKGRQGYAILGARDLGLLIGELLREAGQDVVFLDSNPTACRQAGEKQFQVVYGNILETRTLRRARLDQRLAVGAVTPNASVNLLFVRHAVRTFKIQQADMACHQNQSAVSPTAVEESGAGILLGSPRDLELWNHRIRHGQLSITTWRLEDAAGEKTEAGKNPLLELEPEQPLFLPLLLEQKGSIQPFSSRRPPAPGDRVRIALFSQEEEAARTWLQQGGWHEESGEGEEEGLDR
ncbi:MAG: cation:proton antiporter [Acidobacteriota bacterium]